LLHDQGSNANSNEVIRPLRLGLAESGWDTLSLQLPAAYRGNDAGAWQSRQTVINERLQAGLDWIEARKPPNRVIVALGDSGAIALTFAATRTPEQLQALVLVSSPLASAETGAVPPPLQQRELPILDLYAERDHPPVTATATERRNAAAKAGYEDYRQRVLIGAAAGFHSQEDSLIAAIRAWLANKIAAAAAGR
jgi:dienelactone hydrolase